jgi:murein endopeptidase
MPRPETPPEPPTDKSYCETCGHLSTHHDEAGCSMNSRLPAVERQSTVPVPDPCDCAVMSWFGREWPRPWLPAPEGLRAAD